MLEKMSQPVLENHPLGFLATLYNPEKPLSAEISNSNLSVWHLLKDSTDDSRDSWQKKANVGSSFPDEVYYFHPIAFIDHLKKINPIIQKGDKGKVVEELQIRITGFGGCLATVTFDDQTEKCVKQFQTDYMERTGDEISGIVDVETMEAIDKLGKDYPVNFDDLKCTSCTCSGFGQGRYKDKTFDSEKIKKFQKDTMSFTDSEADGLLETKKQHGHNPPINLKATSWWIFENDGINFPQSYNKDMASSANESGNHYEYPGIHRSLLWAVRGIMFYLKKSYEQDKLSVGEISSGYRCWENNKSNRRTSTNHMGKAIDLWINKNGSRPIAFNEKKAACDKVRELVETKMNGQVRWANTDRISLEPGTTGWATTWVHLDVRTYNRRKYLKDSFFCKKLADLNGKPLKELKK